MAFEVSGKFVKANFTVAINVIQIQINLGKDASANTRFGFDFYWSNSQIGDPGRAGKHGQTAVQHDLRNVHAGWVGVGDKESVKNVVCLAAVGKFSKSRCIKAKREVGRGTQASFDGSENKRREDGKLLEIAEVDSHGRHVVCDQIHVLAQQQLKHRLSRRVKQREL